MKKTIFLVIYICFSLILNAQVAKTINVTAGGLKTTLTTTELSTVTNLTVTGTIDARDFKTMRDIMPKLAVLDIGSVAIVAYTGNEGTGYTSNISYPVNTIPTRAFGSKNSLFSISIPSTVTSIEEDAFHFCNSLTSVTIPPSVNFIGNWAFDRQVFFTVDSHNLKYSSIDGVLYNKNQTELIHCPTSKKGSFTIPETVKTINNNAFSLCKELTSITFNSVVNSIGVEAFNGCIGLTSINIPNSVDSLGRYAFYGCIGLNTVSIPASVSAIGLGCFDNHISYSVNANNSKYSSIDGVLFNKAQTKLIKYPLSKVGNYKIPLTVNIIGERAFEGCIGLTSIDIPSSVNSIEGLAFYRCTGLNSVTIPPSVNSIGYSAFASCSGIESVSISSSLDSIGGMIFAWCNSLTSVIIPSSVTTIGYSAFRGCSGLTSVTIPPSVTFISLSSFEGCKSLTSINIPASVTFIEEQAFLNCSGLTSLTIPTSIDSIRRYTFSGCRGLKSLTIPSTVTFIGEYAFWSSYVLNSIYVYSSTPAFLGSEAFLSVNKNTCIVYVPFGSKNAYKSANQWKDFANIIEGYKSLILDTSVNIAATAGSIATIGIKSNVNWKISSDQQWLTVSPTFGIDNHTLTFTAVANLSSLERKAIVTVSADGIDSQSIIITQDAFSTASIIATDVTRYSPPNGTITIRNATGGSGYYEYSIDSINWQSSNIFNGLSAKSYSVLIRDAKYSTNRISKTTVHIKDNTMKISAIITEIDPKLGRKGAIDLEVTGGSGNYTFKWNNGTNTQNLENLTEGGDYTVQISDSNGNLLLTRYTLDLPNYMPIADAGVDQTVLEGTHVELDGSRSYDPNKDNLTYVWIPTAGIMLSYPISSKPFFLAPEIKRDTILTFLLIVNDGKMNSSPATVKVSVLNVINDGFEFLSENDLKVYPNPANQTVWIENPDIGKSWNLSILTVTGERINSYKISSAKTEIDVSRLMPGVYFFQFENKKGQVIRKILKD